MIVDLRMVPGFQNVTESMLNDTPDDGELILMYQEQSRAFLGQNAEFVATSTHRNWAGKIKCRWCTSKGYAGDFGDIDWKNRHGRNCKKRDYVQWKERQGKFGQATYHYNFPSSVSMASYSQSPLVYANTSAGNPITYYTGNTI